MNIYKYLKINTGKLSQQIQLINNDLALNNNFIFVSEKIFYKN